MPATAFAPICVTARAVAVTRTVTAAPHTEVRCPRCRSLLLTVPGHLTPVTQVVTDKASPLGIVVVCHKASCRHRVEVAVAAPAQPTQPTSHPPPAGG